MASSFLRNSSLRHIFYSFNSRMHSSKFGIPPNGSFPNSPLALLSPENYTANQCKFLSAFSMNNRFLCTGTNNPAANQSASSNVGATQSSGPAEGNSGNKNDGGGSENTHQEGKPVRGGVLSLFSFSLSLIIFLLFCNFLVVFLCFVSNCSCLLVYENIFFPISQM